MRFRSLLVAGALLAGAGTAAAAPVTLAPDHSVTRAHTEVRHVVAALPDLEPHMIWPGELRVDLDRHTPSAYALPGSITYTAGSDLGTVVNWSKMATGEKAAPEPLTAYQSWYVRLGIHETLHRRYSGFHAMTVPQRNIDEGAVEAVAWDLNPYVAWHAIGSRITRHPNLGYEGCTRYVRKASIYATGQPWPSYDARKWRRAFLVITPDQRDQVLVSLGLAPGCQP